jgi:uncharacterized membrane protein YiaA
VSFQTWSVLYVISAIPTLVILQRVRETKSSEAKTSRLYYSACLTSLLAWTTLDFLLPNLPEEQALLAAGINRLVFLMVSVSVFLFVTSSIYFTRAPRAVERLFVGSPIILLFIEFLVDPFQLSFTSLGWQGNIANPALRYSWLSLIMVVMFYSLVRLFAIRAKVTDFEAKRRMTFFSTSFVVALFVGVFLFLLGEFVADFPSLSSIGVNLSLLLTYPAFSPTRMAAEA